MIETIASVATAVGVLIAALGIWQTRRSALLTFELTFTDRYRALADQMPLEALQGKEFELTPRAKQTLFHYLELCEEEMYYRRHGRISSTTWIDWWTGISRNLGDSTPMAEHCRTVMEESGPRFVEFQKSMEDEFRQHPDPCTAWLKRWYFGVQWRRAQT